MSASREHDFAPAIAHCLAGGTQPDAGLVALVGDILNQSDQLALAELLRLQAQIADVAGASDRIALVYGGATKIKGYVFEAPRLPEIRGASALLDWVNDAEIHRLWHEAIPYESPQAPHPYIVYASGGSFLAFAPPDLAQRLATSVEQTYTLQTQTAHSVAVTRDVRLLELRFGRLYGTSQAEPYWVEQFLEDCHDDTKRAALFQYYYAPEGVDQDDRSESALRRRFFNRKTFGELVTVLATMFNRRRDERASHGELRSPPRHELLPWAVKCQSSDVRPATIRAEVGSDERLLSEPSARKLAAGRAVKGRRAKGLEHDLQPWTVPEHLVSDSWEQRWVEFLSKEGSASRYAQHPSALQARAAQDLHQIGAASHPQRYIGLIYADGNNIGRLMATLQRPSTYRAVSSALTTIAQHAVFGALAAHLEPALVFDREEQRQLLVHPFEILAIGGDDLFIVVPGDRAFDIALAIAQRFEAELTRRFAELGLGSTAATAASGRYAGDDATAAQLQQAVPTVGLSAGVLIAQENAPFFFLRDLVEELLKKAKQKAKEQAAAHDAAGQPKSRSFGGAVDFMVMKSTTMVTDKIAAFRKAALQDYPGSSRRLTARPYSWAEFAGLLATTRALEQARLPRSQLYRLRKTLAGDAGTGVQASVMEYLYTRTRLDRRVAEALLSHIEHAWCYGSETAQGRFGMPPWSRRTEGTYETIWPDMVEAFEFVPEAEAQ